jgi:hypothetical protein
MSQRIQELLPELKRLGRMRSDKRKKYIKTCSPKFIHQLCECVQNLLKGNVPLQMKHLKCLQRYKQSLRKLTLKKTAVNTRKKILQKGGFLGFLLKPLIAGLISLVGGYIASRHAKHETDGPN